MANEKIKLDKKDQKLLTELALNSRTPIKNLAKKVGISREVATYRINKLKDQGIIKKFYTIIDNQRLGFSTNTCFIKLKSTSKKEEEKFVKTIVKNKFVTFLGPTIGRWNIVFDILSKNKKHLKELIEEVIKGIGNKMDEYVVIGNLEDQGFFPAKIVGSKKELQEKIPKETKIEEIDLKVLKILSNNSRTEYVEIAERLKMTANAIKYRIKKLQESGIIQGYTISINQRMLGYEWYNLQIKLDRSSEEGLINFLKEHPKVTYYYKYFGNENWDLDIGTLTKDSLDLRKFLMEVREKFGENINIHDIYLVVDEAKEAHSPEGVFETN